jgi:hypothetical protein
MSGSGLLWDVDDIRGLARVLRGFKPAQYLDLHAQSAALQAAGRWPHLAELCLAALEAEEGAKDADRPDL